MNKRNHETTTKPQWFNVLVMRYLIFVIVAMLSVAIFCSCGVYSFSPGGKSSIKTIAISQFENKTIESGLSSRLTDLIVDAFISDGNLKVVSPDKADAILSGTLTGYERKAKDYTASDTVNQYAVMLVLEVTLGAPGGEKELWKDRFLSEGIYAAGTETEEDGQARAIEKLVVDIINRTTKNW